MVSDYGMMGVTSSWAYPSIRLTQTHQENARAVLTLTHYTELRDSKGWPATIHHSPAATAPPLSRVSCCYS